MTEQESPLSHPVCNNRLTWDDDFNGLELLLPFTYRKHPASVSKLFTVPSEQGKGWIEIFTFSDKFKMLIFHCQFRSGLEYRIIDKDWVRFNFSIAIKENMKFCLRETYNISGPSCRIIKNRPDRESTEIIPKETSCIWVTIGCKQSFLEERFGSKFHQLFELAFSQTHNETLPRSYLPFEMKRNTFNVIQQIIYNRMDESTRIPYFEAKSLELLSLTANQLLLQTEHEYANGFMRDSDLTKLKVIYNILSESHTNPPNIKELCSIAGMNRTKLRHGFKSVYGKTMQDFINDKRLEYIKELLIQGENNMAEIAWLVGFKHQCNMTTCFKKKYGMTPIAFRRQYMRKLSTSLKH